MHGITSGRIKEKPVGGGTTRRGAVGADHRGAEGAEGVGCGEGVPPSPPGEGSGEGAVHIN